MRSRKTAATFATFAAVALVAAALVAAGLAGNWNSADAQANDRAVTNFGLDHNNSWHLTFHWDEPAHGIPRDYRVMWAKSSDNYKTWTDESGNAFPTTNSHTVTDVERGVEYKAKVRARYSDGSGPWSDEARYTIPLPPTPTPTPTATPEPTAEPEPPDHPYNEGTTAPTIMGWFDWSDVANATGYDLEQNIHQNGHDNWIDIARPSDATNTRAFVHGSAAIIVEPYAGPVHLRVRATFDDGTATEWYGVTVNTSE